MFNLRQPAQQQQSCRYKFRCSRGPAEKSLHPNEQTDWVERPEILPEMPNWQGLILWARHALGDRNAMRREKISETATGADLVDLRVSDASIFALTSHPPQMSAPPGAGLLPRCKEKTWLKRCLSTLPTRKKPALWWLMEPRLRNLTLNPKTNASSLAIFI